MTADKRSAAFYKQVLDSMVDMVLVKGDRSKLLWANKPFLDRYGMTAEQLEDIVDAPHSDPDDTVQYVKDDHHVYSTGKILDIPSEPITDSQGDVAYVHTIKTPVFDQDGQVIQTVGVSRLIRDEEVLASSIHQRTGRKERLSELRVLVHHIPLAVAMFDVKTRFLSYSEAWRDLFQCGDRVLLGQFYDQTFERCIALDRAMNRAITEAQPVSLDAVALRSLEGARATVDVKLRPWFLTPEEVGGVIVLLHDVTEVRAAQDDLLRLNEELTHFNYRVSHDLLAPLKTVRGFIELCQEELDEGNLDDVRAYHAIIGESVERLGSLVEDVLDLARADMLDTEATTIDLEALVHEIVGKHQADINASSISVSVDCLVKEVRSERVRVLQAVENLIANAIKYHDPAKRERVLAVTSRVRDDQGVILEIRDNGIGFDAGYKDTIFEIFTRGTSKYPGSGLGLYIAKKHMDRLGGTVRALSNRDDTIFEVVIPTSPATRSTTRSATRPTTRPATRPRPGTQPAHGPE